MIEFPWPMDILTIESGERRKIINSVKDITPRSNIKPDNNGILRIINNDLIKLSDTVVYPEVKEQGHFHFYCRDKNGDYKMFGRKQNVNGYYIDIYNKLSDMKLPGIPKETVISIELILPNRPDCQVPTAIKECPAELKIKALGIPIFNGVNLTKNPHILDYNKSRKILSNILPPEMLCESYSSIELGDKFNTAKILEDFLQKAKEKNIEGWVFKEKGYSGWWKLKGLREADVFITGFKVSESDTQYGLITAVEISCFNKNKNRIGMGSVSGFNMYQKDLLTKEFQRVGDSPENKYIGKVIRVVYQEIAGKGKMKHGFFDSWRDDKHFTECSIEQFE